jgi:hypothetical protein
MDNNLASEKRKSNRTLLILFIIAVVIALIPWFAMAQCVKPEKLSFGKAGENDIGSVQSV